MLPAAAPEIGRLESALDNLALAATNDTAVLQQLTAANLALMTTVSALTATNKKLVDAAARTRGTLVATPSVGGGMHPGTPSPATTVGRTATASARSTRVQPAPQSATATTPPWPTPWAAPRRTRAGT